MPTFRQSSNLNYWYKFLKAIGIFDGATFDDNAQSIAFAGGASYFKKYVATKANCLGNSTAVNIISATIGASEIADGDEIEITAKITSKVTSGSPDTLRMRLLYGGSALTLFDASIDPGNVEYKDVIKFYVIRSGSDLLIKNAPSPLSASFLEAGDNQLANAGNGSGVITNPGFGTSKTLALEAKWTTGTNAEVRILQASVFKKG